MQNYYFNYFLYFLIIIFIFLVSNSNFTKKEGYMNIYGYKQGEEKDNENRRGN